MKKLLKAAFFLLFIFFASCEKKISEIEFEKKVMTEILPTLIDSTCIDRRLMLNFSPKYGKAIFDKDGRYLRTDSTKATSEEKLKLLEWKKRTLEIEKDTSKIIIAFDPKIEINKENVEQDFAKHFQGANIFKQKKKIIWNICLTLKVLNLTINLNL